MGVAPENNALNQSTLDAGFYSTIGPSSSLVSYALILLALLIAFQARDRGSKLPELNPRKPLEFSNIPRLRQFMSNSIEFLKRGRSLFPDRPYKLYTELGELTMLPPESVDDIKNDSRFDFAMSATDVYRSKGYEKEKDLADFKQDSHSYIPGFESLSHTTWFPQIVKKHLTTTLSKVTAPLSEEAALALRKVLTDSPDWHVLNVQADVMGIVSRISSRIFMGEELCRDGGWITAVSQYTFKAFQAIEILREYPRWMRPVVHWFLPCCWEVRRALSATREYLRPHVERRQKLRAEALAAGQESPFDDLMDWVEQAGFKVQPAHLLITTSLVAIHSTSDLLSDAMVNIASHPELFQPLREEVIRVLKTGGLKKTSLYELKLMDSVFKETQRLKPMLLTWKRMALEDIQLPDGLTIKKGKKVAVDLTHMWNDQYYDDAQRFDGYRFARMRETPGEDYMARLATTSQNHLGFGHGMHACPGRFFASNEVKIAMCHLILKYDWKLPPGPQPPHTAHGISYLIDPTMKLLIRRREEELDFSALEC